MYFLIFHIWIHFFSSEGIPSLLALKKHGIKSCQCKSVSHVKDKMFNQVWAEMRKIYYEEPRFVTTLQAPEPDRAGGSETKF